MRLSEHERAHARADAMKVTSYRVGSWRRGLGAAPLAAPFGWRCLSTPPCSGEDYVWADPISYSRHALWVPLRLPHVPYAHSKNVSFGPLGPSLRTALRAAGSRCLSQSTCSQPSSPEK